MLRVLIAEDSAVACEFLVYLFNQDPALQVVGTARDGMDAVVQAERLRPDVILMDVHMPRMNGYEATRQIMERVPTPIVVCSASISREEVVETFEALEAGALTVVAKPPGLDHPDHAESARRLVEAVKLMAEVKVVRRWPRGRGQGSEIGGRKELAIPQPPTPIPHLDRKIRLIAMGASTGGPQTLQGILGDLPNDLGAPILLVQHISAGFIKGLGEWLAERTRLPVKLAESGEAPRPRTVYLGPDGSQMGITNDGRIALVSGRLEEGFCPSVSYLFRKVAETYGRSAMGILLTGMGRDGAAGLQSLRAAGGVTIAQDEQSSVVYGMPGEAVRLGAAEYVLPPERIAELFRTLTPHA